MKLGECFEYEEMNPKQKMMKNYNGSEDEERTHAQDYTRFDNDSDAVQNDLFNDNELYQEGM